MLACGNPKLIPNDALHRNLDMVKYAITISSYKIDVHHPLVHRTGLSTDCLLVGSDLLAHNGDLPTPPPWSAVIFYRSVDLGGNILNRTKILKI